MHKPQCLLTVLPVVRVCIRSCIRCSSWLCPSCLLILCCFGAVNITPPQECRPVQKLSLLVLPLQPVTVCLCRKENKMRAAPLASLKTDFHSGQAKRL